MASPGQQYNKKRTYEYGYPSYNVLLKDVHTKLVERIQKEQDKKGADILQKFLQDIKNTARYLNEQTESFKNNPNSVPVMDRLVLSENDLSDWYKQFIDDIFSQQKNLRGNTNGLGAIKAETLFRREHVTTHNQNVDDIVEEEMAAILMSLKEKNGDKVYPQEIMMGKSSAHVDNVKITDSIVNDLDKFFSDSLKKRIEESTKHKFTVGTDQIQEEKSGKIDIAAGNFSVNGKLTINNKFLSEVIKYLQDATFTIKNYKDPKEGSTWLTRLKLGQTNILKSLTAELNIVFPGNKWEYQRDIVYRGLQIIVKTNKTPSASPERVSEHFTHMRFIYELSGLGLLDEQNNPLFAKYLIYNVPNSTEIYVKDTASLILEQLQQNRHYANVFGTLHLNAKSVK